MRTGLRKIKGFYLEKKKGKSVNYKAFDIIRNADKVKIIKKAGFYARLRREERCYSVIFFDCKTKPLILLFLIKVLNLNSTQRFFVFLLLKTYKTDVFLLTFPQ